MQWIRRVGTRLGIAGELLGFLGRSSRWWLVPLVVMLLVLAGLLVLAQSSAVSPFIYTIF